MRRRDFIAGAAVSAAWPLEARAQRAASVRRVGIMMPPGRDATAWVDAFKRGLAGLGWAEGRNIRFVERYATDSNESAVHAAELARLAPDAIIVFNSPALRAMRRAGADLPIVFATVTDPVEQGFVSSLARPGGNITGFAASEFGIATKRLDLLKKLAPSLQRVTFLYDPDQSTWAGHWAEIEPAAPSLALSASKVPVRNAEEIERAIVALAREPDSGLFVQWGPVTQLNREKIAMLPLRYRLPTMYGFRDFVESGGLASYGADMIDLCRRAASYVDRILRGEKPRDLPVQLPTRFEFVLNLKTAKAIGLDIPPQVLALADDVIE
jgi:putative ABC transport system substrate-binding protein